MLYVYFFSLEPTWNRAATKVKADTEGQVKLGKLDATVHQSTAQKYGVSIDN